MTTIWVTFLFAFGISSLATRLTLTLARRWKLFDLPDGYRKLHTEPTPRLGGIAIYIAFFTTIGLSYVFRDLSQLVQRTVIPPMALTGLIAGATLLLAVGIRDDLYGLSARRKLLFQILASVLAYIGGFHIQAITVPFMGSIDFGIFAMPITILWFVGCINAVNLLDGMDGLAAGACMFVFLTLLLVGLNFENKSAMMMACASGATLGFLMHNFPPARIFLGDSGSMLLGFLVAALSLIGTSRKAQAAVALFIPIVALGLPIFDTSMAIVRRWYRRLPLSTPDRQHIHHILVSMGYSQQKSVLILYGICVALAGAALLVTIGGDETVTMVIGSLLLLGFVSIRLFSGVKLRGALSKMIQDNMNRQKEIAARVRLQQAEQEMKKARDVSDAWTTCSTTFHGWGIDAAELILHVPDQQALTLNWIAPGYSMPPQGQDMWSTTLLLEDSTGQKFGKFTIHQRAVFSGSMPTILSEFRTVLCSTLMRVASAPPEQMSTTQ